MLEKPCASIKSPILNGFKIKMITPPEKFCNLPDNASQTAKPAAPIIVTNEVILIPIIHITVIRTKPFNTIFVKLLKNGTRD